MIRYALAYTEGHEFESWFAGSDAYEAQVARGLVTCPFCGSGKVEKALMAPRVGRSKKGRAAETPAIEPRAEAAPPAVAAEAEAAKSPVAMMSDREREFRAKLKELREHLVSNSEHVGARFPEEARRIHYGEVEHRSIYGEASPEEAKALHEEGVAFHPLPILPEDRN